MSVSENYFITWYHQFEIIKMSAVSVLPYNAYNKIQSEFTLIKLHHMHP